MTLATQCDQAVAVSAMALLDTLSAELARAVQNNTPSAFAETPARVTSAAPQCGCGARDFRTTAQGYRCVYCWTLPR